MMRLIIILALLVAINLSLYFLFGYILKKKERDLYAKHHNGEYKNYQED